MEKRLSPDFTTNLRSSVTYRSDHAKTLFSPEIYKYCQSLSEDGSDLYHGVKSNILNWFEQVTNRIEISSSTALLIELSPMFRSNTPSGTFGEFARRLFNNIKKSSSGYSRVDFNLTAISTIVWKTWLETDEFMALSCYLMMTHHYLVSLMIPSWRTMTIKNEWIYIVLINFNPIRKKHIQSV